MCPRCIFMRFTFFIWMMLMYFLHSACSNMIFLTPVFKRGPLFVFSLVFGHQKSRGNTLHVNKWGEALDSLLTFKNRHTLPVHTTYYCCMDYIAEECLHPEKLQKKGSSSTCVPVQCVSHRYDLCMCWYSSYVVCLSVKSILYIYIHIKKAKHFCFHFNQ